MTASRRRRYAIAAAIVTAAVAATVVVVRVTGSDTEVGSVLQTAGPAGIEHRAALRLPYGRVTVGTTDPRDDAPGDREPVDAPDGGSFVGVVVERDPALSLPQPRTGYRYPEPATGLALVAGGRTYPVTPSPQTGDDKLLARPARWSAWVAVDGRPDDVVVSLTYAGVTQTIDPRTGERHAGRAAGLYDRRLREPVSIATSTLECGTPTRVTRGFTVRRLGHLANCEVNVVGPLPYLPGRGWAPKGRTWFAVDLAVTPFLAFERRAGGLYRPASVDDGLTVALDGRPALDRTLPLDVETRLLDRTGQRPRLAVFNVPAGTGRSLTVTAAYPATIPVGDRSAGVPSSAAVTATWTVAVG